MEKEEVTKRFNSAGKSLKQAGNAFLFLPIVAVIIYVIMGLELVAQGALLNGVIIGAAVIYAFLLIIIGSGLQSAGNGLMGIFSENEWEVDDEYVSLCKEAGKTIEEAKKAGYLKKDLETLRDEREKK